MSTVRTVAMPSGTITFLFTDIEGSTRLWEEQPRAMRVSLARHDTLLREAIEGEGGYVFKTMGDAFCAAFPTAPQAVSAALAAQRALNAVDWNGAGPLRARVALHTGTAEVRDNDYFGPPLNRVARLLSTGYGGQILLSLATQQLVREDLPPGTDLKDLGEGGLKDLVRSEHVYQLVAPDLPADFPPLKQHDPRYIEPDESGRTVENPYKGLRAFHEADAPDFFGREELTARLLQRVAEREELHRFLAVVGPSGSGKSSVVRAGLVPALKRGILPGSDRWLIVEMLPGTHPFEELEALLLGIAVNPPNSLMGQLREDERGLIRAAKRVLPRDESTELVLIIDQFEEVFTLVEEEAVRVQFLENLHAAVSDPRSRVRVVITLRADFFDRPLLYPNPGELIRQRTAVVLPLSAEELERAIVKPAQRAGVMMESELVATIIKDVGEQPGSLPLLQYALTELFERRTGRTMVLEAYRETGGVVGALARRAEEIFNELSPDEQEATRQLFLRLVTLGEGAEDTRRRVRRAELASLASDTEEINRAIVEFGRYRLLTFDRDPVTRGPTVEVAHEALLRTWDRLRGWLDASRAGLLVHRQLMSAASEWEAAEHDPSFLAVGARLAQFEGLVQGDILLNREEQTYLQSSIAERSRREEAERERQASELALQRRAANRLRYLAAGMAVFLLVTAGLAAWALNQSALAQDNAVVAQANANEASIQRQQAQNSAATAVANQEEADRQREQSQANFTRAEAQRLGFEAAAQAEVLLQGEGSNAPLVTLLAIRSMQLQYSSQGDDILGKATTLAYPQQQFTGHIKGIRSIAFSPDGKQVLTSSQDGTARLWNPQSGEQVRVISYTGELFRNLVEPALLAAAFSPDGRYVLAGGNGTPARMWDAATGVEVQAFTGHTSAVLGVAFSPDGKQVLIGSADTTARLYDAQTGEQLKQFTGHTGQVLGVAFSPDGKQVLTASADTTARLWDAATGEQLHQLLGHTGTVIGGGVFAPDGKTVLTGSGDKTARLWDAQTGQELQQFVGHTGGGVRSVAFAPDGKTVLTGGFDSTVRLWDVATGEPRRTFAGHSDQVNGVAFSPDGQSILSASNEALLWSVALPPAASSLSGHTDEVWAVTFSPDGNYVLTGSVDGTARLWDAETRAEVQQFAWHTEGPSYRPSVAFSPDGESVLTSSSDSFAQLWDTQSGAAVITFTLPLTTGVIFDAVFTPDGKGVLTKDVGNPLGTFTVWDEQTGQPLSHFTGTANLHIYGFSTDRKMVLTSGLQDPLRIWDMQAGREVQRFAGYTNVIMDAAFSPDGKYVLGGNRDKIAWLWDAQTGREVQQFVGHTNLVLTVAFSPDGKYVLTGSEDTTARLWDAQTGQELRRFVGHTGAVYGIAFAPNGRQIATASADGTARLWDFDYRDTISALCSRMVRDLTDDERAQFGITDKGPTCP